MTTYSQTKGGGTTARHTTRTDMATAIGRPDFATSADADRPAAGEAAHVPYECPGSDGGEFVICHKDKSGKRRTLAHVYDAATAAFIVTACNSYESSQRRIAELEGTLEYAASFFDSANLESPEVKSLVPEAPHIGAAIRSALLPKP